MARLAIKGDQLLRSPMRNSLLIDLVLIFSVATMFSCKSNYICPAFESAYILDQPTRHQKFSLFDEDTLPRVFAVNKNKFGIIQNVKYKKKRDELQTVKMETIFPQVEPPDTMLLAEQDISPRDMINEGDRPVNHYNVDQIYYMRHFGQYLPMPEEPSLREQQQQQQVVEEEEFLEEPQEKKRKIWQFWKKKEQEPDSVNIGFEEEVAEPEERELSKRELRQLEQQERERQEELERVREPTVIDLDDFEKNRGVSTQPADENTERESRKKKKFRLFGGKKNKDQEIELVE